MSALQLTITTAGRNALVNAANTGTLPLTIDRVVLGSGMYEPDEQQVDLHFPIKPITAFGGNQVADDTIHITITDDSADSYVLGEIGLYAGNVLFGIYSQPTAILEKGASQLVLLSADIQFTSLPAGSVTVGDTQFAYPKATETRLGVIEIATAEEVATGTDHERAVTPKTLAPQLLTRLGKTEAAVSAAKWTTSRKLTLTGDVSGYASWDGSGDISLAVTVADNSHAHAIANVTGLQTALDAKLALTGNAASASKLATARTIALAGAATGTATAFDGSANISISVTGLDATKMSGILPDANLSGTYSGVNITGNAATASTLQTARAINGVSFNGAGNITVEPYVELDTTTNASRYLTFVDSSAGGYSRLNLDTALSYNPSTKLLGASVTGNAATATKLATARTITLAGNATGSASFDGSANITLTVDVADDSHAHIIGNVDGLQAALDAKLAATANAVSASKWATARTITLAGDATGAFSLDGSGNVTLTVAVVDDSHAHTIANVDGLQAALDAKLAATSNAVSASKWAAARTITLAGDATGSVSLDGSANVTLTVTVADDSHAHTIANVDGLQTALDAKLAATANAVSASKWATSRTITLTGDITGSVSLDGSGNVSLATTLAVSSGDKGATAATLWIGTYGSHPTTLTLASAISNFKKVRFSGVNSDNTIAWSVTLSYDEWAALCATGLMVLIASGDYVYRFTNPTVSATTLTRNTSSNCYLTKIVGLN